MSRTELDLVTRPEQHDGWRSGRPVEDPEKTKGWGFVTAKPSEYLVHVRRGRVSRASGQGATCFKWPWDAVAVVPTSFQRLRFRADQVTTEKVGVEVVGLAVYRIAEPLIAYRVLNFSYPERAQQKLEETLSSMFVGATRRLVANLSVEDCLKKRKTALAEELLREIAPVVGGEGSPDDTTVSGWGVVIDTIEIQEVRVLSERVFEAMQAPYRSELDRAARHARADAERDISTREAECKKTVEEAAIRSEMAVRAERRELERAEAEAKKMQALREAQTRREVEQARLDAEAELAARAREIAERAAIAQTESVVLAQQRATAEARAEIEAHELRGQALERRAALLRAETTMELEKTRLLAEGALAQGRAANEVAMLSAHVERERAEADARRLTAEHLPELAAAVGQRFGEVKITQIGGDPSQAFGSIAQAITSVLGVVETLGKRP